MMKAATFAAVVLSAVSYSVPAGAQVLPGNDYGSLAVHVGLFSPQTTYNDVMFGESSFASGMATGVSVSTWPTQGNWGFRFQLIRSKTDGQNDQFQFAPIAVNDPTQWLISSEFQLRRPMDFGSLASSPYVSGGVGAKQYNWAVSVHQEDRFFLWTVGAGLDLRHRLLGPFALTAEARGYFSKFRAFGIDDGTHEEDFYGGRVGGVPTRDLMFTTGFSMVF
jgi:hypothetical protein